MRIWCTARRYPRNMCDSTNDILVWWPRNETGCAVYVTRPERARARAWSLAGPSSRVCRLAVTVVLLRYRSMQISRARSLPAAAVFTNFVELSIFFKFFFLLRFYRHHRVLARTSIINAYTYYSVLHKSAYYSDAFTAPLLILWL